MTNHATRVLHFAVTGALLAGGALGCPAKNGPGSNVGRMPPPDDGGAADGGGAADDGDETPPADDPPTGTPPTADAPVDPGPTTGTMNMRKVDEPAPQAPKP